MTGRSGRAPIPSKSSSTRRPAEQYRLLTVAGLVALVAIVVVVATTSGYADDEASFDESAAARSADRLREDGGAAARSLVSIVGDSYTVGSAEVSAATGNSPDESFDPRRNWAKLMLPQLSRDGLRIVENVDGAGGSGYSKRGPTGYTFEEVVPRIVDSRTSLVVFFGSRNDADEPNVQADATRTIRLAKKLAPRARILIIGPPWINEDVPPNMIRLRDTMKTVADENSVTWVDPLAERWFFGSDSRFIGVDKIHPNAAGQEYLARKIAPHIQSSLKP